MGQIIEEDQNQTNTEGFIPIKFTKTEEKI